MKILVTWGSERGDTGGIARAIAAVLATHGHVVTAIEALDAPPAGQFEAAVIGGALHTGRWHRFARQYAEVNAVALRRIPVWFFSSGPLGAASGEPVRQTHALMQRLGVVDHVTFEADQSFAPVRAWAETIAAEVESASPRPAVLLRAHAAWRLQAYALAATGVSILAITALGLPALLTPLVFGLASVAYFRPEGAREPLPAAALFASAAAIALIVVSGLGSVMTFWVPVALAFAVAWLVGDVFAMLPRPVTP